MAAAVLGVFTLAGIVMAGECKLTQATRKFEGADHAVITMENDKILVEVVPELEGRVSRYVDKTKPASGFECLDDCPYHYGGRWEGKPFTHTVDSKGPDRAAATVKGGGKIAVALLKSLLGVDLASPLDLAVERTMSIDADSTRLRVDVKITNTGDGIAPQFRYMVHAVYGCIAPMPQGRAFWFLPTPGGVEFFDDRRGNAEMGASGGGAPVDHPFSRFIPGRKADKPRYEAGGWGAALTSAGPAFIFYDPKQFDFIQYWFGGDAEWHLTFEPHTKPVDLKPGDSVACSFTLAYDAKDVPFATPTVSYERPIVPDAAMQGGTLSVKARATTVLGKPEAVKAAFEVKDPKGQVLLAKTVDGEARPFTFTDLAAEVKLPDAAEKGAYTWKMSSSDGKELASGKFEVVTAEEAAKRQMAKATAEIQKKLEETNRKLNEKSEELRHLNDLWKDEANLALRLDDRNVWPEAPAAGLAFGYKPASTPVLGLWKEKEFPKIKALAPAALAAWPQDPEKMLAALKDDRAAVRDVVPDLDGKGLLVLLVDAAKKKVEVVHLVGDAVVGRVGRFAEKPAETDDTLGAGARAIALDKDGNLWVTTNAWGATSVFQRGDDGAPFEASVVGPKGALKKFSLEGRLLGTVSLLEAPMDMALATADGTPVVLVSYRSVSEYHGAQVREGTMIVRAADAQRIGEIKASAGSIAVDGAGRLWIADVAGHVVCTDLRGKKAFDVAGSPAPAVMDARLPAASPLPVVVRSDGKGGVWALFTLGRKLAALDAKGMPAGDARPVADPAGAIFRMAVTPQGPIAIGDKGLWK